MVNYANWPLIVKEHCDALNVLQSPHVLNESSLRLSHTLFHCSQILMNVKTITEDVSRVVITSPAPSNAHVRMDSSSQMMTRHARVWCFSTFQIQMHISHCNVHRFSLYWFFCHHPVEFNYISIATIKFVLVYLCKLTWTMDPPISVKCMESRRIGFVALIERYICSNSGIKTSFILMAFESNWSHQSLLFYVTEVDHCEEGNGGCDHTCTSEPSGAVCSCDNGYELNIDEKTCDGEWT